MQKRGIKKEIERCKVELENNKGLYQKNEPAIKDIIVKPILFSLGWNTGDPNEVVPEEKTDEGTADYCLKTKNKRVLFIEAKNSSKDVEDHINQLAKYSFDKGVDYGVITNGRKWLLLKSYERNKDVKDRKVWVVDIYDKIETVLFRLNFISKENVKNLKSLVRNQDLLAKAWQKTMESQELLVGPISNIVQKQLSVKKVSRQEIRDFVSMKISELVGIDRTMPNREARAAGYRVRAKRRDHGSGSSQKSKKPKMMRIKGSSIRINYSYEILFETAKYLFSQGLLKKSHLPIESGKGRFIVNYRPKHPNGREFANGKACIPGIYVETNNSHERSIELAKVLLRKAGLSEETLKIEY